AIEKRNPLYAIPAGIMLFLANITWGGLYYINLSLIGAVFFIILLNKNDEITAKTFTLLVVTTALLNSISPNNIGFLSGLSQGIIMLLAALFINLDLYLKEILPQKIADSRSLIVASVFVGIIALGILSLGALGITSLIPLRYYALVNPLFQSLVPIFQTVAEYIPISTQGIIQNFGIALFLAVPGLYFLLRNPKLGSLWLLLLSVISIYATSLQPYLYNYTTYMIAALAGVSVGEIVNKLKSSSRILGIVFIASISLGLVADAGLAIRLSNTPQPIVNAAAPYALENYAWISTLNWLREYTPPNSVIFTWWDYGYWIQVGSNRYVIDENNTLNGTQIKLMATMFLNNESYAVNVLENKYHLYPYGNPNFTVPVYFVAYDAVTVFYYSGIYPIQYLGYPTNFPGPFIGYTTSFGDIAKAMGAMTIIAGYPQSDYIDYAKINQTIQRIIYEYSSNQQFATQLINLVSQSSVMAFTPRAYNSLIVQMFLEAMWVLSSRNGFVNAPFTADILSNNIFGQLAPYVQLNYFQPVYIALFPFNGVSSIPSSNGYYTVYVMVVVYQFVEPGTIVEPQIVINT
ncbi:MAG: STT3 domain-containing protein, partial [Sulfolobales archaeon]